MTIRTTSIRKITSSSATLAAQCLLLCFLMGVFAGQSRAQFRDAAFTSSDGAPVSEQSICDVSALPPFNAAGPWFFSLCDERQAVRQKCYLSMTVTARRDLTSPMMRRAVLRALEKLATDNGGAAGAGADLRPRLWGETAGAFSLKCLSAPLMAAG